VRRLEEAMPVWRSAHAALAEVLEPGLARKLTIASEALIGRCPVRRRPRRLNRASLRVAGATEVADRFKPGHQNSQRSPRPSPPRPTGGEG
jgi:hypothetical protein